MKGIAPGKGLRAKSFVFLDSQISKILTRIAAHPTGTYRIILCKVPRVFDIPVSHLHPFISFKNNSIPMVTSNSSYFLPRLCIHLFFDIRRLVVSLIIWLLQLGQ